MSARAQVARWVFGASCVAVGVLSLTDAGWALRLKAQGYYADLETYLFAPSSELVAGAPAASFWADVYNNGPDPVDAVRLSLRISDGMTVEAPDCELTANNTYVCIREVPLPVYGYAGFEIPVAVDMFSTGPVTMGVLATSDLQDPVPENSFGVAAAWATRRYDVQITIDPAGIWPSGEGLMLPIQIHNVGPSFASGVGVYGTFSGDVVGDAWIQCIHQSSAFCFNQASIDLYPDGVAHLAVRLPPASATSEGYALDLRLQTHGVEDMAAENNTASYRFSIPLFASGFE